MNSSQSKQQKRSRHDADEPVLTRRSLLALAGLAALGAKGCGNADAARRWQVLTVGDSISFAIAFYGAHIFPEQGIDLKGTWEQGSTAEMSLARVRALVEEGRQFDLVLVNAGIGDGVYRPLDLLAYWWGVRALIEGCFDLAPRVAWVSTTRVIPDTLDVVPAMNDVARGLSVRLGTEYIALGAFVRELGPDALLPDGIHLTEETAQLCAEYEALRIGEILNRDK